MAIVCPLTEDTVLYLDCKECDDAALCRKLRLMGSQGINDSKDAPLKEEEKIGGTENEKEH